MEKIVVPKRPREAQMKKDLDYEEYSKRHKPYNHILSLLDLEEEDSTQDLSPLMTSLQQEITCASNNLNTSLLMSPTQENDQNSPTLGGANLEGGLITSTCFSSTPTHVLKEEEEDDDKERVMKHLLQASDDELGIPNIGAEFMGFGDDGFNGGDGFPSLCDKFWELEDERANYYDLLQSELFLWGLCNGTRYLMVNHLGKNIITATVLTGKNIGDKIFIPRMNLTPSDAALPFKFRRRQFPITVCFAMTINKSRGQSLSHVGIYLPKPVFTHG